MGLTYFKRFRMQIDLGGRDFSRPQVPEGYRLLPWGESLMEAHAEAKYYSFRDEIDANVFPCLGELTGCQRLINEIARKEGFIPEATWLAVCIGCDGRRHEPCGTIQGIRDQNGVGAIQNLGVIPEHRGGGLGTSLLFRSLEGFRQAGVDRVRLEVTAENKGAVHLYHRHGFNTVKTVFKAAEVAYT